MGDRCYMMMRLLFKTAEESFIENFLREHGGVPEELNFLTRTFTHTLVYCSFNEINYGGADLLDALSRSEAKLEVGTFSTSGGDSYGAGRGYVTSHGWEIRDSLDDGDFVVRIGIDGKISRRSLATARKFLKKYKEIYDSLNEVQLISNRTPNNTET